MGEYDVSRRSFLKGIGLAGLSAGALGTLGATGIAFADDAPAVEAGTHIGSLRATRRSCR